MNRFFTSDLHLDHFNIILSCNRPFISDADKKEIIALKKLKDRTQEQQEYLNLKTSTIVRAMNETLIDNHNAMVNDDDEVYNLGDFAMRMRIETLVPTIKRFKGKLKFILGNHDVAIDKASKRGLLNDLITSGKVDILGQPYPDQSIVTRKMNGETIVMAHYSLRSWVHAPRGSIHLFGHSHGNLPPHYRSFDVGVDCHNFKPVPWDEMIILAKSRDGVRPSFNVEE